MAVRVEPPALRLIGEDDREVARWPLDAVRYVEKPVPGQVLRLRCGFDADDRLTLPMDVDPTFLRRWCPDLGKADPAWKKAWRPILLWGSGAVTTVAFLVFVGVPFLADQLATHFPRAWEKRLGTEVADNLAHVFAIAEGKRNAPLACTDAAGQAAFDGLAKRLLAGTGTATTLRLHVVDTRLINAMALPGGNILVLRGLIDFVESPDELAGVLAHEIGHEVHRDPLRMLFERGSSSALFGLLFGDIFGGMALAQVGDALVNASYSRDKERAADAYGVQLMESAGFDAGALATFLKRLEDKKGDGPDNGILAFFASHPAYGERAQSVGTPKTPIRAALSDSEWRAIKEMCAKRR